ncbi:MAG: hypothetical protein KAV82_16065 [Phycisphaerae bacterium]|nr:hypothetical protein [Phycisphaerae bacterium]
MASAIANDRKVVQSIEPVDATAATTEGTVVDWSQYNRVDAVVGVGLVDASHTLNVYLEHCDTSDGSYLTLAATGAIVTAGDQSSYLLSADRVASSKKYVCARLVRGGSDGSIVGVTLLLSNPKQAPAA